MQENEELGNKIDLFDKKQKDEALELPSKEYLRGLFTEFENDTVKMYKLMETDPQNPEIKSLRDRIYSIIPLARHALSWRRQEVSDSLKKDSLTNVLSSLLSSIDLVGMFKYNEFSNDVDVSRKTNKFPLITEKKPLYDQVVTNVRAYLDQRLWVTYPKDLLEDGIRTVAQRYAYHPIKQRIESKKWDGTERLDTAFIDYLGAEDTELNKLICRTWFCGAVARIYDPGVKFELMPILTGLQGQGKSTFIKSIARDFYKNGLQKMDSTHQATFINLKNNWIIEIAELSAMSASTIEETKDFLSTDEDKGRLPYGKNDVTIKRHNAMIGTTNQNQFLKDKTGNRRFPTVKCWVQDRKLGCDPFNVKEEDMQQILAEAKYKWEHGQIIYLEKSVEKQIEEAQKDALVTDEKDVLINDFLNMPIPDNWNEYKLYEKQNYFKRWSEDGQLWPRLIGKEDKQHREIEIDEYNPGRKIEAFTVNDVMQVVFNRTGSNYRKDGLYSSVKATLDGVTEINKKDSKWKYTNSMLNGKKQRHYKALKPRPVEKER